MLAGPSRDRPWGFAAAPLALLSVAIVVHWATFVPTPRSVGQSEAQTLNIARLQRAGAARYGPLDRLPAVFNPYGPVYPTLLSALPASPQRPYVPGRLVSLTALAGLLLVVGGWIRARTGSTGAALLAVLLLCCTRPVYIFAPLCRVDLLAVLLSTAGLCCLVNSRRPTATVAGIVLLALALHTKLSQVAAPLAAVILLWPADRRRAVTVGLGVLALTVAGIAWLDHTTGGRFLEHALRVPGKLDKGLDVVTRPLTTTPLWVALAVALRRRIRGADTRFAPEAIYLGMTVAVTVATGSNWGASWNYLIELYVAFSLYTGVLLGRWFTTPLSASSGHEDVGADEGTPTPEPRSVAPGRGAIPQWLPLLLAAHGVYAGLYAWHTIGRERALLRETEPGHRFAVTRLAPLLAEGERVAVIDSYLGLDALLTLGGVSLIDLPNFYLTGDRPALVAAIETALHDGGLDQVLAGPDLAPWPSPATARTPRRPPPARPGASASPTSSPPAVAVPRRPRASGE